ncbi:uncharacterized protein LOC116190303 [Punica granatum]|uniref:Uncharacterized protein LOC116190303 n=1 Tax=Punica granatum TaxID=22663 RepID=A0A6P8C3B7_PUNGR|nr:uncharacterized protein LOC116190303 [Punica granatum]
MATDQEISQALHSLLRDSYSSSSSSSSANPNKPPAAAPFTSFADVVQQLESRLGLDLTHKVDFIRSQIQLLFRPQPQPQAPPQLQQQQPPYPPLLHRNDHQHFGLQQSPNFYPHHHPHAAASSAFHGFPSQYAPAPPPPVAPAARPVEPPKESAPAKAKRKGGAGGLNKLCGVSPELQAIVGEPALPRTEIVKQLWAYIRKNNLQDPSNKRKIICNDELKLVFETDCTDMFKMNKLLAKHIIPLDPTKQPVVKKQKSDAETGIRSTEPGPSVKISDALAKFFGVDEKEMLLTEINKRIWEYINVNQLQDPQDTMLIQCDAKLQEIFGCESIHASGISEVLARQYIISS